MALRKRKRSYASGGYKKKQRYTKYRVDFRDPHFVARSTRMNRRTAGFIGLEKKFFDSGLTGSVLAAGTDASGAEHDPTTLLCLNCPAQGDMENNRDGRQITMSSIQVKGVITIPSIAADAGPDNTLPTVFIALVLDKQTNGAQLDSEDVFCNVGGAFNLAASPFRELENVQRFRILASRSYNLANASVVPFYQGTAGSADRQGVQVPFSFYKSLKGMKVNFATGQTTSVIAAIQDNSIHIVAYTSNTTVATQIDYASRLRFYG